MKSGNVGSPLIIFVSIFLSSGGNFETSYKHIILLIFDVVAFLQKQYWRSYIFTIAASA